MPSAWALRECFGYDMLTRGDRIALTGGFGVGFVDGDNLSNSNSDDDVWGGRVGAARLSQASL